MEPKRLLPAMDMGRPAQLIRCATTPSCPLVRDARVMRLPKSRLPPSERRMLTAPKLVYDDRSLPLG
jgi:hypothetical protein